MRGWTHYLSGLAMTTFFPSLLRDLAGGNLLPVVAGIYAYLPDFLDFKIKRFFWRRDVVIDPSPQDPAMKVSPTRIRVKDLSLEERWRFYYIEGVIEKVVEYEANRVVFMLRDETGVIRVEAREEDHIRLLRAIGEIREGMRVRIPGYLEIDEEKNKYWIVADAPHPQYIAELLARAIDRAYETGKMITVKIFNIRMKGDVYRRFLIHYDSENKVIKVFMGPIVSSGGLPIEGTDTPNYRRAGEAKTKYPFKKVYPRPTVIDAFNGPEIGFIKVKQGDMEIVEESFIPWHRGFTHSFTAGLLLALPLYIVLLLIGYSNALDLALASMLGYWMHVIEDQLGFMGSELLPPLTKRRIPGLMLGPRMYGAMNFAAAWFMIAVIVWNINRYLPVITPGLKSPIPLAEPIPLLIVGSPSIALFIAGAVDRIKYGRALSKIKEEKKIEESLEEEREEVGGF
ncbi:MAG: metal-dependent hydrolase [Desulfurococcaceae archaeon]